MPLDRQYLLTEFDREKRLSYLKDLEAEDCSPDTAVYLRLHEFRYVKSKKVYCDTFMRFWLELVFCSDRLDNVSGINSARKAVLGFINDEVLNDIIKTDEQRDTALYDELLNSVLLYFKTCASDSHFTTRAFGLMKLGSEALMDKIAGQAEKISVKLPEKTGLTEELKLVSRVVSDGFELFVKGMKFI